MKRILLILSLLILWTGVCSAENYKYLMTDDRGEHYIDLDSVKDVPNNEYKDLVRVKTKVVLNEEFKEKLNIKADYFIETYIIDRDSKAYSIRVKENYINDGTQTSCYEFPANWTYYGEKDYRKDFVNKILKIKEGK